MSFIHYVRVGRFERDEHGVRLTRSGPGEPNRPVVREPLTAEEIATVVGEVTGTPSELPEDWSAWLDGGYLVCDKYTRNVAEIDFITRLVERTGAALYDGPAYCELALAEWLALDRGGVKA